MTILQGILLASALLVQAPASVVTLCERSITTTSGRYAPSARRLCSGQVIFEENFDAFKEDLWRHDVNLDGGGNGEFQWYTDSARNSFTRNGWLHVKPSMTTDEIPDLAKCKIYLTKNCYQSCRRLCSVDYPAPPVQSALLRSRPGFNFKYGRLVVRAKLPIGDWLWPSIHLLPTAKRYGEWPRSGEIRLLDARGNARLWHHGKNIGVGQMRSTVHFGTDGSNSAWQMAHFTENVEWGEGLHGDFHVFQLDWAPTHIRFSLDDRTVAIVHTGSGYFKRGRFGGVNPWRNGSLSAPFDQEFYFALSLAVGGTNGFFPDTPITDAKPWRNNERFPLRSFWKRRDQWMSTWDMRPSSMNTTFLVDYIRVYAL